MIYDAHLHFIPKNLGAYSSTYPQAWQDKDALFDFLEANDIAKAVVSYPITDAHRRLRGWEEVSSWYNSALEELGAENKRIIPCAIADISDIGFLPERIKELSGRGFKAISFATSYDGKFIIDKLSLVFEAAHEYGMVIFIHPQMIDPVCSGYLKDTLLTQALGYSLDVSMCMTLVMLGGITRRYNIKFVFSSLGGVLPFLKDRFDEVYNDLKLHGAAKDLGMPPSQALRDFYVDTCGASLNNIKTAIELFGEDKILWGSGYPACKDAQDNINMLDKLGPGLKEKITCKNFNNII